MAVISMVNKLKNEFFCKQYAEWLLIWKRIGSADGEPVTVERCALGFQAWEALESVENWWQWRPVRNHFGRKEIVCVFTKSTIAWLVQNGF